MHSLLTTKVFETAMRTLPVSGNVLFLSSRTNITSNWYLRHWWWNS